MLISNYVHIFQMETKDPREKEGNPNLSQIPGFVVSKNPALEQLKLLR